MKVFSVANLHIDKRDLGTDAFIIKVMPYYEYINNEKSDKIAGYKYTTVFPARSFDQIDIKIVGEKLMESPLNGYVSAKFDNLQLKLYYDHEHNIAVTASADSVHPVGAKA